VFREQKKAEKQALKDNASDNELVSVNTECTAQPQQ